MMRSPFQASHTPTPSPPTVPAPRAVMPDEPIDREDIAGKLFKALDVDGGGSLDQTEFCSMATSDGMRQEMEAYFQELSDEQKGDEFELSLKEFVAWLLRMSSPLKDVQFEELVDQMQTNVDAQVKLKTLEKKRRSSVVPPAGGNGVSSEAFIELQNEIASLRTQLAEEREEAAQRQEQALLVMKQELAAMSAMVQAALASREASRKAAAVRRRHGSSKRALVVSEAGGGADDGGGGTDASADGAAASPTFQIGHEGEAGGSSSTRPSPYRSAELSSTADEDRLQDGERTSEKQRPGRERTGHSGRRVRQPSPPPQPPPPHHQQQPSHQSFGSSSVGEIEA